jgi:hypothetical protein
LFSLDVEAACVKRIAIILVLLAGFIGVVIGVSFFRARSLANAAMNHAPDGDWVLVNSRACVLTCYSRLGRLGFPLWQFSYDTREGGLVGDCTVEITLPGRIAGTNGCPDLR